MAATYPPRKNAWYPWRASVSTYRWSSASVATLGSCGRTFTQAMRRACSKRTARDVQVGVQGEPLVTRQAENRDRRQCHDDQTAGMGRVAATAFVGTNQTKKAGTEIVPPWRICSSHSVSMTVVSAPGSNISAGAEQQRVQLARTNTTGHAYSAKRTPSGSPR